MQAQSTWAGSNSKGQAASLPPSAPVQQRRGLTLIGGCGRFHVGDERADTARVGA